MKKRLFFSFKFFVKIALATVLPIAVFAVLGILLDKKLQTTPSLSVVGIVFSMSATVYLIKITTKNTVKRLQKLD